jgi:hypothetical protein
LLPFPHIGKVPDFAQERKQGMSPFQDLSVAVYAIYVLLVAVPLVVVPALWLRERRRRRR